MKGLLKTRSGLSQFLFFISIAIVSFVVVGSAGSLIAYSIFGKTMGLKGVSDLANIDYSNPEAASFIRALQVIQFISLFVIPTFICAKLFSLDTRRYLGLKAPANNGYWIAGIALLILAIPFTNLLGQLNQQVQFPKAIEEWMKKSEDDASKAIKALLSHNTIKDLLLNLIFIAGLAAVGEELVFRGMIQRLLIKVFKSPWAGIIVSAILFSAIHMQFYGFLPRFALGILLGAIYWYSGSLYAAMLAHFVYDGFVIVVAWFMPETLNESGTANANIRSVAAGATIGILLIIFIMGWMKKRSQQRVELVYAEDAIPVKDHPF
jgi:membrane protease YdiL (CAAX protease family)